MKFDYQIFPDTTNMEVFDDNMVVFDDNKLWLQPKLYHFP